MPSITATRSCKETRTTDMRINKIIDAVYYRSCSSHWLIRTALLTRASLQTFCHLLIRIPVFVMILVVLQYHYAFLIYDRRFAIKTSSSCRDFTFFLSFRLLPSLAGTVFSKEKRGKATIPTDKRCYNAKQMAGREKEADYFCIDGLAASVRFFSSYPGYRITCCNSSMNPFSNYFPRVSYLKRWFSSIRLIKRDYYY